jgi:diguanylate cyclase (GGDEF)-like protein/PAS domain S-box-containing protein
MGHVDSLITAKIVSVVLPKAAPSRLYATVQRAMAPIVEIDLDGRLLFINKRFADMLGYALHELLGSKIQDMTHPDDIAATDRNMRALIRTREESEVEKRYLRRDGTDVWVKVQCTVNLDDSGRPASIIAIVVDITEQKDAQRIGEAKLSELLGRTTDSVLMLDRNWSIRHISRHAIELLGCSHEPKGRKLWDVLPFQLGRALRMQIKAAMEHKRPVHSVHYVPTLGRWLEVNAYPCGDGMSIFLRDLTEDKKHEQQIQILEQTDLVTGLPNRRAFDRALNALGRRSSSAGNFAVICLDLDQFTALNDTFGHTIGDQVLKQVATRLQACMRSTDVVTRLGNDEFAVLYVGEVTQEALKQYTDRIQRSIGISQLIDATPFTLKASVGIAVHDGICAPSEVFRDAEIALWCAKERRSGTVEYFESSMAARLKSEHTIRSEMDTALTEGQFENYYQPLLDLKTQQVRGFEALIRWNHPTRGLLAPGDFIHIAESSGMIGGIGEWAFEQACEAFAGFPEFRVAVNFSPTQMKRGLARKIADVLARTGLLPGQLELEITESMLLESTHENRLTLDELKAAGIRIVLDDFGSGYSSLSYLQSFPFDKIKLDRSIASAVASEPKARAIVHAVVGLAKALGTAITAEGVETQEQLEALRQLGCDQAQGYLLGRPVPFRDIGVCVTAPRCGILQTL